jgi:hypothetical protein
MEKIKKQFVSDDVFSRFIGISHKTNGRITTRVIKTMRTHIERCGMSLKTIHIVFYTTIKKERFKNITQEEKQDMLEFLKKLKRA